MCMCVCVCNMCICAYNIFSAVAMIAACLCCPCIAPRVGGGVRGAVAPFRSPADCFARVTLFRAEPPGEVFGAEIVVAERIVIAEVLVVAGVTDAYVVLCVVCNGCVCTCVRVCVCAFVRVYVEHGPKAEGQLVSKLGSSCPNA